MHAESKTLKNINLALFDFDGTLCSKDSFTGFVFFALSKRHIIRQGLKILPWIQAYYLKVYPAHAMRNKLFRSMFQGYTASYLSQLGQEYAQTLLQELDPKLWHQVNLHRQRGDQVVIVSASIDIYLKPLSELLGLELICTEVEEMNGEITGRYATPDCSCEQKKYRILQRFDLNNFAAIYAYGNSYEDRDMLDLADYHFMVGESAELPPLMLPEEASKSTVEA